MKNNYLIHYGTLGQKWGVRRYQNEDGTLTAAGKSRYGTDSVVGRVVRATTNTSFGQRLIGVGTNKGYREDKKEIKNEYNKQKEKYKSISDKKERKAKMKSLKNDYRKTKAEARTTAAKFLYPWQSDATNEKTQSEHYGKQFVKDFLFGSYGTLNYNRMRVNGNSRIASAAVASVSGIGERFTQGLLSVGDYAYNSYKKESRLL